MAIKFSEHFLERSRQRDIPMEYVRQVVRKPDRESAATNPRYRKLMGELRGRTLAVIVERRDGHTIVVSAYWPGEE